MIAVLMRAFSVTIVMGPAIHDCEFTMGDRIKLPDHRSYRVEEVDFAEEIIIGRPHMPVDWVLHFWYYAQARWKGRWVRSA